MCAFESVYRSFIYLHHLQKAMHGRHRLLLHTHMHACIYHMEGGEGRAGVQHSAGAAHCIAGQAAMQLCLAWPHVGQVHLHPGSCQQGVQEALPRAVKELAALQRERGGRRRPSWPVCSWLRESCRMEEAGRARPHP